MGDIPELPLRPILASILAPVFPGVKIATKVPSPIPATFIRVERVGGDDEWAIDRPMVAIQFWATSDILCEQMAYQARNALRSAQGHIHAGAIINSWTTIGGPHDFPDIESSPVRDRWQYTGALGISTA